MTTIAVKDGVMAADTLVTCGGPYTHMNKIQRIGTVSIAGICGEAFLGAILLDWLRTKRNPAMLHKIIPPDSRDSADVIELTPGGIVLWNGWGVPLRLLDKQYAIGSGAMAAMSAMLNGDSAEQAVRMATRMDEYSGLPIQVERLKPPKRKR